MLYGVSLEEAEAASRLKQLRPTIVWLQEQSAVHHRLTWTRFASNTDISRHQGLSAEYSQAALRGIVELLALEKSFPGLVLRDPE